MKNTRFIPYLTIVFLVVSIGLSHQAKSQKNLTPGFIIDQNNDTIHGLIDYRKWKINPKKVHFKEQENSRTKKFRPLDIKAFQVGNSYYAGEIVNIETSPRTTARIEEGPALNLKKDTIFLEVLFEGKKSLYHYGTRYDQNNFYIKQKDTIELLKYKKYFISRNGSKYQQEKNTYRGQLMVYLNDCQTINKLLEDVQYKPKNLQKLFKKYYECVEHKADFKKAKGKIKLEPHVLAGLSVTSVDFQSGSLLYMDKPSFSTSTNFTAAFGVDFIFPKNLRKWAIGTEVMYYNYLVKGEYEDNGYITNIEIGSQDINLNLMLKYRYVLKNSVFMLMRALCEDTDSIRPITKNGKIKTMGILVKKKRLKIS